MVSILEQKIRRHLSSVSMPFRDFTSYLITWWCLVEFSMLIICLPFVAGGQPVNLYGISLDSKVSSQALDNAIGATLIFYPILLLGTIAIFLINLYDVKHLVKHRSILFYLTLLVGLVATVSQNSAVFAYPWLLLAAGIWMTEMWKDGSKAWNFVIDKLRAKRWQFWHWKIWPAVFYLLGLFVINIAMFVNNNHQGFKDVITQYGAYLSTLAVFLLFLLVYALFGRFWGAMLWVTVAYDFFYLFDIVMRLMRNDAIVPADVVMIKAANSLAKMISPILVLAICLVVVGVGLLGHVLKDVYPMEIPKTVTRIAGIVIGCGFYLSTAFWNHPDTVFGNLESAVNFNAYFFNQAEGAQNNGPWWQFLQNVDIQVMDQPKGYSKANMLKLAKAEQGQAKIINQTRHQKIDQFTVIYNLSESFADPSRVPGVSYKGQAIPFIKHFKKTTNSGLMMSSGFGGGTANMEYMTLTSMPTGNFLPTMSVPFTQLVPFKGNHQYSIARDFKYSVGIHPYNNQFYDRATDYPKLGIKQFYNLSDPKHPIHHQYQIDHDPYMSDFTAYDNVFDQLSRHHGPQFIDLVTMQNHMPYDNKYYDVDHWQADAGDQATDTSLLEQYLTGISYTNSAVHKFVNRINHVNRPIAWVFYGDHLPGFYTNDWETDGPVLHQTDYWVYLNPAARRKVGTDHSVIKQSYTDPTQFTALVLSNLNAKVTPFEALQTQVAKKLPVKSLNTQGNSGIQFFNPRNGKIVKESQFSKSQKKLWYEYRLVQYDQTAGHNYLKHDGFYK